MQAMLVYNTVRVGDGARRCGKRDASLPPGEMPPNHIDGTVDTGCLRAASGRGEQWTGEIRSTKSETRNNVEAPMPKSQTAEEVSPGRRSRLSPTGGRRHSGETLRQAQGDGGKRVLGVGWQGWGGAEGSGEEGDGW